MGLWSSTPFEQTSEFLKVNISHNFIVEKNCTLDLVTLFSESFFILPKIRLDFLMSNRYFQAFLVDTIRLP